MSRDIKFRAWITKGKESEMVELPFAKIGYYDFDGSYAMAFAVDGYADFSAHEKYTHVKFSSVIMQYTGLQDKNGKEICEGDVVRIHNLDKTWKNTEPNFDWKILEIKWNKYTWAYSNSALYMPLSDYDLGCAKPYDIEIIGNIHQNPELSR